jgi:hypothetical protein
MLGRGNWITQRKPAPSPDLGSNLGRPEKPATNRLSYGYGKFFMNITHLVLFAFI